MYIYMYICVYISICVYIYHVKRDRDNCFFETHNYNVSDTINK